MDGGGGDDGGDDELFRVVSSQHFELLSASAEESDLDLAFRLQLQEAINASLSSSPRPQPQFHPPPPDPDPPISVQTIELQRFLQEHQDAVRCRAEMARVAEELRTRAHDERFARELLEVPDDEWERIGDNIEKPVSAGGGSGDEEPFNLYFKGLRSEEVPDLAAVGIAVCDPKGRVVLKIQRPVLGPWPGGKVLNAKALLEGLQAAQTLGIRRLNVHVDSVPLYNHLMGKWTIKQRSIATVVEQVWSIQKKFDRCMLLLLPRFQIQFVIKLAKDAIDSQMTKGNNRSGKQQLKETCTICLEDTDGSSMFTVDGCKHRFCFSCMKQHVEVKLLHGAIPGCPHEGCKIKLEVESSNKFLPRKLSVIMAERVREASIPEADKVYCPYPKCSALMSRKDVDLGSSSSQSTGARMCMKCRCLFCINCKVPWHTGMSCRAYQVCHPLGHPEDATLQALARTRSWRQCIKCKQMIELAEGCYHMTCRCGYEFCYTCGAPWANKKATCGCPLWDERYILHNQNNLQLRNNPGNLNNMQNNPNYLHNQNHLQRRDNLGNLNNMQNNPNYLHNQNNLYDDDDDDYDSSEDDYFY